MLLAAGPALTTIIVSALQSSMPPIRASMDVMLHEEGPPLGHTGGFGEPTCQECHSEFDVNTSEGALGVDGFPLHYSPGAQYLVSISIMGDDMQSAGFQAAIRFMEGPNHGTSAGALAITSDNVVVRRAPENKVDYLQHTPLGSRAITNGVASWTVVWTAPQDTTRIVLHVAGNNANGDNSPLGDFVYTHDVVSSATSNDVRDRPARFSSQSGAKHPFAVKLPEYR